MDKKLLNKHIKKFIARQRENPGRFRTDADERAKLVDFYRNYSKEKIISMDEGDIYQYS